MEGWTKRKEIYRRYTRVERKFLKVTFFIDYASRL
jgi:hypothetical protein